MKVGNAGAGIDIRRGRRRDIAIVIVLGICVVAKVAVAVAIVAARGGHFMDLCEAWWGGCAALSHTGARLVAFVPPIHTTNLPEYNKISTSGLG